MCNRRRNSIRFSGIMLTAATLSASLASDVAGQGASSAPPSRDSASNRITVAFNGEVRSRTEWDHPGSALPNDLFTYLRTRFGTRIDSDAGVHLVLQAQDSRVLVAEGHAAAALVEEFGLHQAFLELRGNWRAMPVVFRAGRQEIAIGNERLIGAVGWSNTGRSFDGARLTIARPGSTGGGERWSASAFAATVEERGRHFGGSVNAPQSDHMLAGVTASKLAPFASRVEVTAFYDAGGSYRKFVSANRFTLDSRFRTSDVKRFAVEVEAAVQTGTQRDEIDSTRIHAQSISAGLAAVRVGHFSTPSRRRSFVVGADLLSGDASPHDNRYGSFSTMYASNHSFYGLMDAIGDPATTTRERGLLDIVAAGTLAIGSRTNARAEAHRFALASGTDRDLGWEVDVLAPVRILPTTTLDLGFSVFRAGAAASSIGLGKEGTVRDWAFAQLRVAF